MRYKCLLFSFFIFLVVIFPLDLAASPKDCGDGIKNRIVYQQALKLSKKNTLEGFYAFCQLAHLGDHRAQYQLARLYLSGIPNKVNQSIEDAYIWAAVSNSYFSDVRKEKLIKSITNQLNDKQINILNIEIKDTLRKYSARNVINTIRNNNKHPSRKLNGGSHIKRKEQ